MLTLGFFEELVSLSRQLLIRDLPRSLLPEFHFLRFFDSVLAVELEFGVGLLGLGV
jgi:hypothetical protein